MAILTEGDKYQIETLVNRIHVATPPEKVRSKVLWRIRRHNKKADPELITLYLDYAELVHARNLKTYRDVMTGNL